MPNAAVMLSATDHPGMIAGPGSPTVTINGLPAAIVGDQHVCAFPTPPGHPPNAIITGSPKVKISGRPAARVGDQCACGAQITVGSPTVSIN